MTLQYCPECCKMQEFNGDFCCRCGANYTKKDLLDIIEHQDNLICSMETASFVAEYVIDVITNPI